MNFKRLLGIVTAVCAVAVLAGSIGAGAAPTPAKHARDLSTNAGVREYLRSVGISSRGVVIQRGARNYAGPRCPGKRWTCTRAHRVVQVATGRGKNSFRCWVKRCVVVQLTKSPLAANTAKCMRTTGITQSCSITQTGTGPNTAIVVEIATKASGLTQNALQTAQIAQTATALDATTPLNVACVVQRATITGSTTARTGVPVTVTLDSHQSISITQNSHSGGNTVQKASDSGACASGTLLEQSQTITSIARGSRDITQKQNAALNGPNMRLNIQQNQADGFHGSASGVNTAAWSQTNKLTAFAISPLGSVTQVQSTEDGGLEADVNQFSTTPSVIDSHQSEDPQCLRIATSGTPSCASPQPALPANYTWSQTQFGPMRKDPGSTQEGNDAHQFMVDQDSTQTAGEGDNVDQSNVVEGDCETTGNCTVDQTTTVQGDTTHNRQSGQTVSTSINCDGTACTTDNPNVLIAGTGDLGNPEPNDNLTQLLTSAGYSVTESATLPANLGSFGQVWWVDANPPTSDEQNQLIDFAESGKGVFLTGERPCCEALNAADQSIVNSVVVGGGITVGGQGDVCGCNAPLPVNPGVVGDVATQPFIVTTWQPAAPGGMANVPDSSVFSYYQPGGPETRQVVAAVWDRPSVVGNGRLAVFMDINWTESAWRAANWSDVAQNVAFFLSGLSSPPGAVVTAANVVPAGPARFVAQAQASPAWPTPRTASGGASTR
jgi:hypothetical protein